MIQDNNQILLKHARDPGKLSIIRERLSRNTGRIFNGVALNPDWAQKYLGDTYEKVILAPKGIDSLGESKDSFFTVLGGWCAVRTKCLRDMGRGILTNPISGKRSQIKSISQVAYWIENAISADQIVETIGIYKGLNYAAISEENLWTKKVINTLELNLNRDLIDSEKQTIRNAIIIAEEKRYKITKKYIEYILNKKVSLTRIVDTHIYEDLIDGRDTMFERMGITVDDLVEPLIERILNNPDAELKIGTKTRKDLLNYINSSSLVWFMYTGPYLKILQKKKFVTTKKGIIIEPWSHAISNESEAKFNSLFFTDNNSYLYSGGINEDIAFITIDEVSSYNWKPSKGFLSISEVPNINNYESIINQLQEDISGADLNLGNNKSFMYGVNYLPYGDCKEALIEMIHIADNFHHKRKVFKNTYKENLVKLEKIQSIKGEYSKSMKKKAEIVNMELKKMFSDIFTI